MNFLKISAASVTIALFGGAAMAQDTGGYLGVGVDAVEFDSYNVSAKAGYNFSQYFGVESQGGIGVADAEDNRVRIGGTNAEAGMNYYISAFFTGRIPASESFDLISRVGYYYGEVGSSLGTTSFSSNIDGIAAGAGGQFNFGTGKKNGIRAEYTYMDANSGDIDLYTISFIRKF